MLRGLLVSLCVVAGCGKVQVVGNNPDASVDADLHGVVHVTVLDVLGNGALAPNLPVIFQNPDGTIAADTTSDSDGRAQGTVLPGASVSVVWSQITTDMPPVTKYIVGTVFGIKPGDDIPIGFTDRDFSQSGTFNVNFSPMTGATSYEIFTPCGGFFGTPNTQNAVSMENSCKLDHFDLYVVASNSAGTAIGTAQIQNVSLAVGSAVIPNSYVALSAFSSTYTDIPADVTTLNIARQSAFQNGFAANLTCTPAAGDCSLGAMVPTAGTKSLVRSTFTRNDTNKTNQTMVQRVAGNSVNYNLDVGTNLLPWMSDVTFDPTTLTITPILEAPDDVADVFAAEVTYTRGTTTTLDWLTIGPTPGPVTLPTLPPHVGPVAPLATDTNFAPLALTIDSNAVTSWDQARPRGFELVEAFNFSNTADDIVRSQIVFGATTNPSP